MSLYECQENGTTFDIIDDLSTETDSLRLDSNVPDTLNAEFLHRVRPFIDVIDELKKYGLEEDVNLPNVVVVGDQSSGKSSIIEAISGIQLPRGKGMVTRCPLELQLKRVPKRPWNATLRYRNLDKINEEIRINRPEDVGRNILQAQDEMCEGNKGVSRELITLRIESPDEAAPDLTLIDLPGITRTPVAGQPSDICERIQRIIKDHIQKESTVILCVISANLDAAVNESITLAKKFDSEGVRTLGIITKPDTAENSNKDEILSLLNNKRIHLEKGFHMVKCRSQKELEEGLSVKQSLEDEKIYFQKDRYYKKASENQLGIPNLSKRITAELVAVIKTNLPNLRDKISSLLHETQHIYQKLPESIPEETQDKLIYLNQLISDMSNEVSMCLEKGKSASITDNKFFEWRQLFDKMRAEFNQIKENSIAKKFTIKFLSQIILRERRNEIGGFLNFEVFEELMKEHVLLYKRPAETLLINMKKNTEEILNKLIIRYFDHLPIIQADMKQTAYLKLDEFNKAAIDQINSIFEKEKLIFTLDQVFEREIELLRNEQEMDKAAVAGRRNNNAFVSPETYTVLTEKNAERLLNIINCYLRIIHFRLCDTIPMTIRQCLHIELGKNLKRQFFMYIKTEDVELKLRENNLIQEKRLQLKNKIKRLQFADSKLTIF